MRWLLSLSTGPTDPESDDGDEEDDEGTGGYALIGLESRDKDGRTVLVQVGLLGNTADAHTPSPTPTVTNPITCLCSHYLPSPTNPQPYRPQACCSGKLDVCRLLVSHPVSTAVDLVEMSDSPW